MEDYLNSLSQVQRECVEYIDGPSLVVAGAGSGKTRVLTYKIAYLINNGYKPYQILALTFTKKAATEMKERIAKVVGEKAARDIWMGTFHSIFARILRAEADKIGLNSDFTIYDTKDSENLIKAIIREKRLDEKIYKSKKIHQRISSMKNDLITPKIYRDISEFHLQDQREHWLAFADIYQAYCNRLYKANAMDFDDILLFTNILFRDSKEALFKYQNRFRFVLVDEYQDTNSAQHRIVKRLCSSHGKLCVVGDDAQSIYSFRGADISNILQFRNEFQNAKIFRLEQNYRSTQNIVKVADSLIRHNRNQIEKNVFSTNEVGEKTRIVSAYSDQDESRIISNDIAARLKEGAKYDDFAILYRNNAQSRLFEITLLRDGIPSKVWGGLDFFQRKEVKDVFAYCRLCVNSKDEDAFRRCVNYPARGIGDTTINKIFEVSEANNITFWDVLENLSLLPVSSAIQSKLAGFKQLIDDLNNQSQIMDAYHIIEYIISRIGIVADIRKSTETEKEAKEKEMNLNEILKSASEFCERIIEEEDVKDISLRHYMDDIALLSAVDKGDASAQKVTLMTIHASKGLEYKYVYIAGCEEGVFPSSMSTATDEDVEEERRLMYVAITRAEKGLMLSYCKSRMVQGKYTSMSPSRFLKELDPNLVAMPRDLFITGGSGMLKNDILSSPAKWSNSNFSFRKGQSSAPAQPVAQPRTINVGGGLISSAAARTKAANVDLSKFTPGSFITHEVYGIGQILSVEGSSEEPKAIIKFNNHGEKRIHLKYAASKMKVIQ